ncbi:MAG: excinuclease ABC subunit UvrB [Oscillospiraceae bacterium]|nr:excinuclease ABC subunit UvrB [Oscillospiraceae bacterium]
MDFKIESQFKFLGDQEKAVKELSQGIKEGLNEQTLLGVTGSGKTFTMAGIIEKVNKPTLVLAHNKTLAAQLCSEFKSFFPKNSVEYFVSYYDYYRPEAYIAATDTYIEKDSAINDEIDKLRHSATSSLIERSDVIVVASVSCIYNLGNPHDYRQMTLSMRPGMNKARDEVIAKLVELQYMRSETLERAKFRVRGDVIDIFPAESSGKAIRVEFFGDEIESIFEINSLTGEIISQLLHAAVYPASHYIVPHYKIKESLIKIESEMLKQIEYFKNLEKFAEANRIEQRTRYDMEMLEEIGFCKGIENYSRVLAGLEPGTPPFTLFDFFPKDFLMFVDESHVTLPQVHAMHAGDRSRKTNLVEYGFRLPSARDNRPLTYEEFYKKISQVIFVSATPGDFELQTSSKVVEQIIRPTGLIDPKITVLPIDGKSQIKAPENYKGQISDLLERIKCCTSKKERVLITTLTKKMAEDLTSFFENKGIKVRYMHSDVETIERMEIIKKLRLGEIDVLVGINLLREGLDIPEVSLVAILDADKEGFLRTHRTLIQTIGRAARNVNGEAIMYADVITGSMERAIDETLRRRKIQEDYNIKHSITPKSVKKDIFDVLEIAIKEPKIKLQNISSNAEKRSLIKLLTSKMKESAKKLDFETAAALRDEINKLKKNNDEKIL